MKLGLFQFYGRCCLLLFCFTLVTQSIKAQAPATYSLRATYDSNLVFEALKIYDDYIYGVASFASTSVVFGGTSYLNTGSVNHLIYKMDTLGNVIWARQVEGSGASDFGFVTNDLQHHIYVGGHFDNDLSIQGQTMSSAGLRDIGVIKLDSSGNLLDLHQSGGALNDTCFGLAIDYAQNYYMWTTNVGNYSLATPPSTAYVFLKLDSSWNEVYVKWMRPFPYLQHPATSILTNFGLCYSSGDTSLVFTGKCKSGYIEYRDSADSFFFGNNPEKHTDSASYIIKVDKNGHVIWDRIYDAQDDSYWVIGICVDDSSHLYVATRWQWSLNGFGENTWYNFGKNGTYYIGLNEPYSFFGYAVGYPLQMNYYKGMVYALLYQERLVPSYSFSCSNTNTYAINWNTQANTFTYRKVNLNYSQVIGFNGEFNFFSGNQLLSTCNGNCIGIPFVLSLPHELKLCGPDTIKLPEPCQRIEGGSGGYTYHWSPGVGLSDSTVLEPTFLHMAPSTITYTLTVIDAQGNSVSDTVRVSRYANPIVTITTNPLTPTCANSFDLLVHGDTSYTNEIRWGTNSVITDSVNVALSAARTFIVTTVDTNQCMISNGLSIHLPNNSHSQYVYLQPNQLPYFWDGENCLMANHNYEHKYTNSSGCDSIEVLRLVLKFNYYRTIDTQVCSSNFPFIWKGNLISQAGTYIDTMAYYMYDSIISLNVSYKEVNTIISSMSDTVCANSPFNLYAQTLIDYCTPTVQYIDTTYYITEVNFNNGAILNNTGMGPGIYNYYSTTIAHVTAGLYYPILINCNYNLAERKVWIDFDQNGEFSASEGIGIYSYNGYVINIHIPNTAINGNTRMRIACKHYEGINLPCYNNGTGEYEDYPIYIHGGVEKYTWSPSSNFASFYGDSVLVQSIGSTTSISVNTLYDNNCHSSTSKIIYVKDSSLHLFVDTICSNQLPYLWQGDTILNSGTYSKQFTNALGCDSTFVLNLQVNEADTILVNDTICSAQLPFVWQGQSLSGSGVYSVIFQNQHGCDSLIRLLLTVNPSDTTTILDTVCSNQLPYMWQGQQITSSGLYSTTLQNALGCDSLLNLNLTVHPSFNSIQYDTICSNDLPFYWQEHFITSAGFYADTLQSVMQCDSILSLNLIVYDNYIGQLRQDGNRLFCPLKNLHNYNWFFNGRLLKNTDTSLLITESGNYELQAWSAEGCMIKFTTTVLEESFTSMHVYPNPAHTIFYIDFDLYLPSVVYLKLTDVTGNVIKVVSSASKLQPGRQRMEFDLTDLDMTNGIYFLERNDDTGSWIEKVSIVK